MNKYVVVDGKRIKYDSRYDTYPYCFFDLRENELDMIMDVVRRILLRCRKKFKSAELSSFSVFRMLNKRYEVKVIFFISVDERLAYEEKRRTDNG